MEEIGNIIVILLNWFSQCIQSFMQNEILRICILIPVGTFVIYKAFDVIKYLINRKSDN